MKGLTTCLWFDSQAEEAARFYTSLFKHSTLGDITRYGEAAATGSGQPVGSVLTVEFELAGDKFIGLNGGSAFKFTEAISITVNCEDQEEVDKYWYALSAGGSESQCGWLKDRYGLSWQIVPVQLEEMRKDKDPVKAERVMAAMMQMKKIDIATLDEAFEGTPAGAGR